MPKPKTEIERKIHEAAKRAKEEAPALTEQIGGLEVEELEDLVGEATPAVHTLCAEGYVCELPGPHLPIRPALVEHIERERARDEGEPAQLAHRISGVVLLPKGTAVVAVFQLLDNGTWLEESRGVEKTFDMAIAECNRQAAQFVLALRARGGHEKRAVA